MGTLMIQVGSVTFVLALGVYRTIQSTLRPEQLVVHRCNHGDGCFSRSRSWLFGGHGAHGADDAPLHESLSGDESSRPTLAAIGTLAPLVAASSSHATAYVGKSASDFL
jgi:hypothetical protein